MNSVLLEKVGGRNTLIVPEHQHNSPQERLANGPGSPVTRTAPESVTSFFKAGGRKEPAGHSSGARRGGRVCHPEDRGVLPEKHESRTRKVTFPPEQRLLSDAVPERWCARGRNMRRPAGEEVVG